MSVSDVGAMRPGVLLGGGLDQAALARALVAAGFAVRPQAGFDQAALNAPAPPDAPLLPAALSGPALSDRPRSLRTWHPALMRGLTGARAERSRKSSRSSSARMAE
jgi:hypothetical protein